jgi:hypothetical protein
MRNLTVCALYVSCFAVLLALVSGGSARAQAACTVFVSDLTGDDVLGDGSQPNPFQSISAGIADALVRCSGGGEVRVGGGSYAEYVALTEGIDLLGGYQCDLSECTWARNSDLYDTAIINGALGGVHAGSAITRATRIDGFRIVGLSANPGSGGVTAAITVDEGTPVVSNNRIFGGVVSGCSGCTSAAIRVLGTPNDAAGALILDNSINAGDSSSASYGVYLAGGGSAAPVASIMGNVVEGATAPFTRGVFAMNTGAGTSLIANQLTSGGTSGSAFAIGIYFGELTVDRNLINADPQSVGSCTSSTLWCGGIESLAATATITNNVVFGMPAPKSAAVFFADEEAPFATVILNANSIDGGGEPDPVGTSISTAVACRTSFSGTVMGVVGRIRNNLLLGGLGDQRYAVYEDDQALGKTCRPEIYEFNAISSVDFFHREWTSAGTENLLTSVSEVNLLTYAENNLDLDCEADATFHIPPTSPCIDAGVLSEAPPVDIDGEVRPQGGGIDIGADEVVLTVIPALAPFGRVLAAVLVVLTAGGCLGRRRSR